MQLLKQLLLLATVVVVLAQAKCGTISNTTSGPKCGGKCGAKKCGVTCGAKSTPAPKCGGKCGAKTCGPKGQLKPPAPPSSFAGCKFDEKTSKSVELSGYVVDTLCYENFLVKQEAFNGAPGTAPDKVYLRDNLPQHTRACLLVDYCAKTGYTLVHKVKDYNNKLGTLEAGAGARAMFKFLASARGGPKCGGKCGANKCGVTCGPKKSGAKCGANTCGAKCGNKCGAKCGANTCGAKCGSKCGANTCIVTLWGGAKGKCAEGNGKYDMAGFESKHPGGADAITRNCGKDVENWLKTPYSGHPGYQSALLGGKDLQG